MSFQHNFPTKRHYEQYYSRKEQDSLRANIFINCKNSYIDIERTSAFTSKGSLTLEAALVVPIFFFAMLCLVYLFEMTAIQTAMQTALHSVGREAAKEAYTSSMISDSEIEQKLREHLGADRLNRSIISGGAEGLDCRDSTVNWSTAEIELAVSYHLEIPVFLFRVPAMSRQETLRIKGWTGYVSSWGAAGKEETVYVTDYGLVYHKERECTYLELSVRAVQAGEIEQLRNQSGGKYYACSSCKRDVKNPTVLYVTDYGDRYHTSLECSKIKRNVYAVPLDEVYGLGGCSKCVK